jgi:DNA polymerase-3 subunit gamma/tau
LSQVLALKYRPSTFDKLIGQDTITQTLTHALDQNRLSHAYLFSGLRGSGKTSTARIFSKALICENGPTPTPCEVCENCTLANENRHIDIIEMDAASSRKIDDIRNLIEQTKYKPNIARFKVFIIDEVHMLTREAFNALLKTLEEPPEYVKFILATTDPMKLPPTILSRTQHFRFKKIANSEVVKHLSNILNLENIEFEKEALSMLSRAGNGSLRDTLTLLDQAILYSKKYVDAKSVALMLGILDPILLDNIINSILRSDKDAVLKYIKELESHESEVVIDELIAYVKEKFLEEDARFSTLLSDRFFRLLAESKSQLYLNADSGFTLTLLFFKMIEATKIQEVDIMIDSLESKLTLTPKKELVVTNSVKSEVKKEHEAHVDIPKVKEDNHQQTYQTLISKLHDRNYELGECFKSYVDFISFENSILNLRSSASLECQDSLRNNYSIIKHFVQDIFGIGVKLKVEKVEPKEKKALEVEKADEKPEENQGSSCVENQVIGASREIERTDILEDPFVQKAKELFEPSKIVVKSKV